MFIVRYFSIIAKNSINCILLCFKGLINYYVLYCMSEKIIKSNISDSFTLNKIMRPANNLENLFLAFVKMLTTRIHGVQSMLTIRFWRKPVLPVRII